MFHANDPSLGLLILRVIAGVTLAAHGYNKFFGGGKIPGTARWFDSMGMKPNGKVHAVLAASTEIGSGLLFAAGLLTPFAAAGMVGLMTVAGYTTARDNGFFIFNKGWEYNLILATVAVSVATMGPGRYSMDKQIDFLSAFLPNRGLAISLGLGLLSGIGLLVVAYRPPAKDDEPDP